MNGFILTQDQQEVFDAARAALKTHKSILIQAATGFGKSVVGSFIAKSALDKGNDVIIMMHRKELCHQISLTFKQAGIPHSFISASYPHNSNMKVFIASVGTLANRLDKIKPPRLLMVDESHHANAATWEKCIAWAKAHKCIIVGLSATPWRLSGDGLKQYFDHMVKGPPVSWLIANGRLSTYRAYVPHIPDMSKVHHQGGDFVTAEVEEIMMEKSIITGIVDQWRNKAYDLRTLVFARSVKHSESIVAQFNAAGISAVHVDANTADAHRKQHLINFANGHIKIISNVGLFGEGLDISSLVGKHVNIKCVIQANPTESLSMHLQQLGRALRKDDEGDAILLDHAGNILRHGLPDTDYDWSLEPREKKKRGSKKDEEATVRIKQCPVCYYACSPALRECPECHHIFVIASRKAEEVDGDLREIKIDDMKKQERIQQGRTQSLEDLIIMGKSKGYKNPQAWARYIINARLAKKKFNGK